MIRRRTRTRRGSVMIEFALMLPMFLFFVLFSIDAGRLMLMRASLQDATQQAARAGAQVGGALQNNVSLSAFDEAVELAPGMDPSRAVIVVLAGNRCTAGQKYVTVRSTYEAQLATPGLVSLLRMISNGSTGPSGGWVLRATSTARCEIVVPG